MGNGESLHAVDHRVHTRLSELAQDEGSLLHDADRHLLIVSHVSPIKSALTWAMGVHGSVAWRMRIDNGGVSVIGSRRGAATLVRANVVPPLPKR
jgi:probable phosphoglycerate mutase